MPTQQEQEQDQQKQPEDDQLYPRTPEQPDQSNLAGTMSSESKRPVEPPVPVVEEPDIIIVQDPPPTFRAGELRVTVEARTYEKANSGEARKIAHNERLKHGLANGGLQELSTYMWPVDAAPYKDGEDPGDRRWRKDFKIVPGI